MTLACEIGLSHDGSLGYCYNIAKAIADAGANAIKFQCHDGDKCNQFRPDTFFPQDQNRLGYWSRTGFTRGQWARLTEYCKSLGLKVGITPFSVQAAHKIESFVDYWKIGSGQTADRELIRYVHGTAPLVISTGMSDFNEAARARSAFPDATLLQCCSKYPTGPRDVGLNVMHSFGKPYGISDHSGTIWPSLLAAYLGASHIEVHVCWDRRQWGPDIQASITVQELQNLSQGLSFVREMHDVDKDSQAASLEHMRALFRG